MTNQINLETLKQLLPEYKVIDISIINDFDQWSNIVSNLKFKEVVVLVSFRTNTNTELWSFLDDYDQYLEKQTGVTAPACSDFKLWNKEDYLNVIVNQKPLCGSLLNSKEYNLRRIISWLENDKDSCYICTEQIKYYGYMCPRCFKTPCVKCFYKLTSYSKNMCIQCPVCRDDF